MFLKNKSALAFSGVSIAISLYQFFLLANMLERLARLLPGMKGMSSMGLIIAAGLGELAFIYTRFPDYQKRAMPGGMVRRFLAVTLVQAYLLAAFVPIRIVALARAFGIPTGLDVYQAGDATDATIFFLSIAVAGICLALFALQPGNVDENSRNKK